MNKGLTNVSWSNYAESYEGLIEHMTVAWARDSLRVAHHRLRPQLLKHKSASDLPFEFLDVGCGPGTLTFEFATMFDADGAPFHITATDLADGMLERVNARINGASAAYPRFANRVTTIQMDGRKLDKIPDASVDAIGSNFGLSIFPERTTGWASAHRVLRDDGLLIVTAWHPSSANMEWFDTLTTLINASKAESGEPPLPLVSSIVGPAPILGELTAAGFRDIQSFQTTHSIVDDFDVLLGSIVNNPATGNFIQHLSMPSVMEEITKLLRKQTDAASTQSPAGASASPPSVALFSLTAVTFVAKK